MKKGFIATSLIYSFFLVFCAVLLSYVAISMHNKNLIDKANENIRDNLDVKMLKNVSIGSYVKLKLENPDINIDDIDWIVQEMGENVKLISSASVISNENDEDLSLTIKKFHNDCLVDIDIFDSSEDEDKLKLEILLPGNLSIKGGAGTKANPYVLDHNSCFKESSLLNLIMTKGSLTETEDDYGVSYYLKGNVSNNYVEFAGMCWQVVRILGNGAIKIVLYSTSNSCDSYVNSVKTMFNSSSNDNAYVGYKYGLVSSNNYNSTSEPVNNSDLLNSLKSWQSSNLVNDNLIDTVWCNDKRLLSGSGYAAGETYYRGYDRIDNNSPSLICDSDNSKIIDTIGVLSADEVLLSIDKGDDNSYESYLFVNDSWWTMTPAYYKDGAYIYTVSNNGEVKEMQVASSNGMRPAITLKPSVKVASGNGTYNNPYVIK